VKLPPAEAERLHNITTHIECGQPSTVERPMGVGMNHPVTLHLKQASPLNSPVPRKREPAARRSQAQLEIHADAFSDEAIKGLVEAWFVPMVVDNIIERMIGSKTLADPLPRRGNYEYDNFGSTAQDDKESKRRTAADTRSAEADVETAIDVDGGGAQSVKRVRDADENDGE
jgi:hypothetical protein